jgi:uncharacterized repeat protein (TIGR03847 family)
MEFLFDYPDRCVVGTVGQPGERAFYLQVRQGNRLCSVLLEKQQAEILALKLAELLDEARDNGDTLVPTDSTSVVADIKPLDMPLSEEFRVMRMGISWEPTSGRVWVEAASYEDDEEPDDSELASESLHQILRIALKANYAREFIRRTMAVVSAGRRACPICEQPMHPSGHICPRANGYHRLG